MEWAEKRHREPGNASIDGLNRSNSSFCNVNSRILGIKSFQPIILSSLLFFTIFFSPINLRHVFASDSSIQIGVLADSILLAENNPNYGILKPIKGRNYRKACIQTIQHAQRDWDGKGSFIAFLGSRYCPTSGPNIRPAEKRLNRYWVKNVSHFYSKLSKNPNTQPTFSSLQSLKQANGQTKLIKTV